MTVKQPWKDWWWQFQIMCRVSHHIHKQWIKSWSLLWIQTEWWRLWWARKRRNHLRFVLSLMRLIVTSCLGAFFSFFSFLWRTKKDVRTKKSRERCFLTFNFFFFLFLFCLSLLSLSLSLLSLSRSYLSTTDPSILERFQIKSVPALVTMFAQPDEEEKEKKQEYIDKKSTAEDKTKNVQFGMAAYSIEAYGDIQWVVQKKFFFFFWIFFFIFQIFNPFSPSLLFFSSSLSPTGTAMLVHGFNKSLDKWNQRDVHSWRVRRTPLAAAAAAAAAAQKKKTLVLCKKWTKIILTACAQWKIVCVRTHFFFEREIEGGQRGSAFFVFFFDLSFFFFIIWYV